MDGKVGWHGGDPNVHATHLIFMFVTNLSSIPLLQKNLFEAPVIRVNSSFYWCMWEILLRFEIADNILTLSFDKLISVPWKLMKCL